MTKLRSQIQILTLKKIIKSIFRSQMNIGLNNRQVMINFMNLCATMIQANFKGYNQRKYYRKFLPVYRRFKQLLYAGFLGWKTRKVLKLTVVKAKINDIKTLKKQQKSMQVRIAKRDFSDQINKLLKNGMWMFYFMKQKKKPLTQRSVSISNKNQSKLIVKTNLKQALKIIPKSNDKKNPLKQKQVLFQPSLVKKVKKQNKCQTKEKQIRKEKSKGKELRFKKFEPQLKQTKKIQKQKQAKLEIQTQSIQTQFSELPFNQCQTPCEFLNNQKPTKFTFHTKPRYTSLKNNQEKESKQVQPVFMKIQMLGYSSRKGLNMTLSKKYVSGKKDQVLQVSQNTIHNYSKIETTYQKTENLSEKYSSLSTNDVTPFNEMQQGKIPNNLNRQKVDRIIEKKALITLDMKKQDFQKKKLEFQKRSQKFKSVIA